MSNLYWLSEDQMARLRPYFPKSRGVPRVDDRRVLSGIIFINRNGLRWRDAPREYGPAQDLIQTGDMSSRLEWRKKPSMYLRRRRQCAFGRAIGSALWPSCQYLPNYARHLTVYVVCNCC